MKHQTWFTMCMASLSVMLGLPALAVGDVLPPPDAGTHRLLAAAAKKKEVKKEPAKAALSEEDTAWLKKNYGGLIARAKSIKEKKAEVAQALKSSSGRSNNYNRNQNQNQQRQRNAMRQQANYMKEDLTRDIAKWHKSYDNALEEKKTDLEKDEKSLAETQAKIEKAKAENNTRDAEFNEKMVPAREAAVKKAQKEYETLQGLPSVIVEMP